MWSKLTDVRVECMPGLGVGGSWATVGSLATQFSKLRGSQKLVKHVVASLLTRRVEDGVKGENDVGARVSAALRVNCPRFPGLARCHQHVVGLQGGGVYLQFACFIMETLHKLHTKSQFQ